MTSWFGGPLSVRPRPAITVAITSLSPDRRRSARGSARRSGSRPALVSLSSGAAGPIVPGRRSDGGTIGASPNVVATQARHRKRRARTRRRDPVSLCVHIVDSAFGVPAADVDVLLRQPAGDDWRELVRGRTGQDGRLAMLGDRNIQPGIYQVVCDLDAYYAVLGSLPLHPRAIVEFRVTESDADIHLPIVVSTHSFLSYRGA
ncbi:hydroxyisourate hydrolase [Streptomyces sp. NPDC087422]|uniref:hydroxyisourate hydrolase n=1 Tax=Streptomyces sp. NPDC087422 TaxID=3365786 RepID=UPI0038255917